MVKQIVKKRSPGKKRRISVPLITIEMCQRRSTTVTGHHAITGTPLMSVLSATIAPRDVVTSTGAPGTKRWIRRRVVVIATVTDTTMQMRSL